MALKRFFHARVPTLGGSVLYIVRRVFPLNNVRYIEIQKRTRFNVALRACLYIDDVRTRHNINIIVIGVIELCVRACVPR
jgi:hypothetical protein